MSNNYTPVVGPDQKIILEDGLLQFINVAMAPDKTLKKRAKKFWKEKVTSEEFPDIRDTTELLLHFISDDKTWAALRSSTTRNVHVYKEVAGKMIALGYGPDKDETAAGEMVKHRWKNLGRKYRQQTLERDATGGSGDTQEDLYFEKLDKLLGSNHDTRPQHTRDTLDDSFERPDPDVPESIHKNVKNTSKPSPKKRKLDFLISRVEKGQEENNQNFKELINVYKEGNNKMVEASTMMANDFHAVVQHVVGGNPT